MNLSEEIKLSIIIVTWNCAEYLEECLSSIKKNSSNINYEVVIVDNNSQDRTKELIKDYQKGNRNVELIGLDKNVGFPAANNVGFSKAKGKYVLALNPDTIIKDDTLKKSIEKLVSDEQIGCLGVKTLKSDGSIQLHCARKFPTLWGAFWEMLLIDKLFKSWKFFDTSDMPYWDHNDSREVDMLQGAYMMFPKKVYENLGGFDTTIPMYYEDIEYCARIKKSGYKIYYLADAEIIHYSNKSSDKADSKWIAKLRYDALYHFFNNYRGRSSSFLYIIIVLLAFPLRLILSPLIALGYYIIKKETKLKNIIGNVFSSAKWSTEKLKLILKS